MYAVHPQYIKDAAGNNTLVVLPVAEFARLMEDLEDFADVRAYDAAKAEDDGERIPMEDAFAQIEAAHKNRQA